MIGYNLAMFKRYEKRSNLIILAAILAVLLMIMGGAGNYIAGTSTAKPVAKVNPDGTFIFGSISGSLTNLNPITATSVAGDITALLYSSLLYPGSSGGLIPWLAKSYNVSNDGLTITFYMVNNATWSNGNQVTAKDVNFTFQSILKYPSIDFNSYNKYISSIDATNDYTVVFHLKMYYNPLIYEIGTEPIVPSAWGSNPYTANLSSFTNYATNITSGTYSASKLITDGPVILTSLSAAGGAVFKTNQNFFKGAPDYAKMIWEFFQTTSDATAALESKSIDAFWGPYTDKSLFAKLGYLRSVSAPSSYIFYIWFNDKIAPFNNTDVRKAVAYVIDKQYLNDVAIVGAGLNGSNGGLPYLFKNQIPSGLPYYHHNLTAATNMMTAAGFVKNNGEWYYPNGTQLQITLIEPPLADWVTAGQIVAQNLSSFGIKTTYTAETFATWNNNVGVGDFQLTYFGYTGYAPTAWSVLDTLFNANSSAPIGKSAWDYGWNVERYNNSTVNMLLAEAASTPNASKEQNYLNLVQTIVANQLPLLVVDDPPTFFTYNNQTIVDNTPSYNIAWMISVENIQVLEYANQTSPNHTLLYVISGISAAIVIGGIAAAVILRSKKLKKEREDK